MFPEPGVLSSIPICSPNLVPMCSPNLCVPRNQGTYVFPEPQSFRASLIHFEQDVPVNLCFFSLLIFFFSGPFANLYPTSLCLFIQNNKKKFFNILKQNQIPDSLKIYV